MGCDLGKGKEKRKGKGTNEIALPVSLVDEVACVASGCVGKGVG
jgi:hypothetical protein